MTGHADAELDQERAPAVPRHLKLLSYNIQVGMDTGHYGHYVTRAWRHALPGAGLHQALDPIADLMSGYDFVAVQEGDAGSLRTLFRNQIDYLAKRAGFAHCGLAVTRDLRPMAQHCLGYLSRVAPRAVERHALPTKIPGRGAMRVSLGAADGGVDLLIAHLSLGRSSQQRQLDYLAQLVQPGVPSVLMGDLNCDAQLLRDHPALRAAGLLTPAQSPATFPSWQPRRALDHILVTPQIELRQLQALPRQFSDHLPLSADISLVPP